MTTQGASVVNNDNLYRQRHLVYVIHVDNNIAIGSSIVATTYLPDQHMNPFGCNTLAKWLSTMANLLSGRQQAVVRQQPQCKALQQQQGQMCC
jgi:hypothetical protein